MTLRRYGLSAAVVLMSVADWRDPYRQGAYFRRPVESHAIRALHRRRRWQERAKAGGRPGARLQRVLLRRRRLGGVHIRASRFLGYFPGANQRDGPRAAHRRARPSTIRARSRRTATSLAFVSTRDTGSTDIYLLDLKTRRTRNLTNSPGGDYRPSWSPDGRTDRVFVRSRNGAGAIERQLGTGAGGKRLRDGRRRPGSPQTAVRRGPVRRIAEVVARRHTRGLLRTPRRRHLQGTRARRSSDDRVEDRVGRCRDRRPRRAHVGSGAEAVAAVPRFEARSATWPSRERARRWPSALARTGSERRHQQPGLVERWPPGRVSQWIDRDHSGGPQARRLAVWPSTRNTTSVSRAVFRPCRQTDDNLPSASEPAGGTPTIGPRWSSGIPMARTRGASSTPKGL